MRRSKWAGLEYRNHQMDLLEGLINNHFDVSIHFDDIRDLSKKDYVREEFKKNADFNEFLRREIEKGGDLGRERHQKIFEEDIKRRIVSLKVEISELEKEN